MSIHLIQGAVEEGLIYALVAIALFISYKILSVADMTTDASFVLGSACASILTVQGQPILGLILAVFAGMCAGLVTATLQTRLGVPSILAGIITMTGLYTVNLLIQGGAPNMFFPKEKTIFSIFKSIFGTKYGVLITAIFVVLIVCIILTVFFKTRLGLSIRATGDNMGMVSASSINPKNMITIALCISNGITALGGALIAQKNTQGDINMGTGIVVIGLASLVIGGAIFKTRKISLSLIGAVVGAILYRIIYTIALKYTPSAGYLKFVSAFIVAAMISYPTISSNIKVYIKRRKELKEI